MRSGSYVAPEWIFNENGKRRFCSAVPSNKRRSLVEIDDLAAKRRDLAGGDRLSPPTKLPLVEAINHRKAAKEERLAAAGGAKDRDGLADPKLEVDFTKQPRLRIARSATDAFRSQKCR